MKDDFEKMKEKYGMNSKEKIRQELLTSKQELQEYEQIILNEDYEKKDGIDILFTLEDCLRILKEEGKMQDLLQSDEKIKNWLIYYPIEKYLCKFANIILTTNQEDYDFIEKRFKVQNLKKINGFGIICKSSTKKLSKQEIKKIYNHFDLNEKDYIFLSIGNLTENQNHIMQIDAVRR